MFKNRALSLALAFLMAFGNLGISSSFAQGKRNVKLWVNGDYIISNQAPFIENSRTYVPARFVSESLGCKVDFNANTKQVYISKDKKFAILTINSKDVQIDGKVIKTDSPAIVRDSRLFVPLRLIESIADVKVSFSNVTKTAVVGDGFKDGAFYPVKYFSRATEPFVPNYKVDFDKCVISYPDGSKEEIKSEDKIIEMVQSSVKDVYKDDFKENLKVSNKDDFVFDANSRTITKYTGSTKDVIIPSVIDGIPVENIADEVFKSRGLETVFLPEAIKTIGKNAFSYNSLTHVIVPSTVKEIGDFAFYSNKLVSVNLPDNLEKLGNSVFGKNTIYNLNLPESLKYIGSYCFTENSLSSISLPDSVEFIGESAFFANQIKLVKLPKNIKTIEMRVFSDNLISVVKMPDTVVEVKKDAFANNLIEKVEFSENLVNIGDGAFRDNKIAGKIVFPKSLEVIGEKAFFNNRITKIKLPENIKTIYQYAFYENSGLKELEVPWTCKLVGNIVPEEVNLHDNFSA